MASDLKPERAFIGGIEIPRMLSGLWQLAGGHDKHVNIQAALTAMRHLAGAGLDGFDMADHYGSAELVIGEYNSHYPEAITAFTKWCPAESGVTSFGNAQAAVEKALTRMNQRQIALLQYHIWDYTDQSYLHNMCHLAELQKRGKILRLGLTNTDAAHLQLLLDSGIKIVSNQISCSVIDRRLTRGRMAAVCQKYDVGILAYGTLLGGFLSEKWVGKSEPQDTESMNWSLRKYLRFIKAAGGWNAIQIVLGALASIATKYNVPIAAVATRYVLDQPAVKAVIVGTRLSEDSVKYIPENLKAFAFKLDAEDMALIVKAQEELTDIPGDCGDEYRRAPLLTVTGDLSHHLEASEANIALQTAVKEGNRIEYSSGSKWESIAGYCRAVRTGDTIRVSGTTANSPDSRIKVLGGSSAASQTVAILDSIACAVRALGGEMRDVVRTRIMVRNAEDVEEASRVHSLVFGCLGVRPSNTLVLAGLVGEEYLVEIEAEAVIGYSNDVLRL